MDTERLTHLIAKFSEDHPNTDADALMEFAQHVRRVLLDDLREEAKAGDAQVALSFQLHGQSFSAKGPRSYVEGLLGQWQSIVDALPKKNITPGFNRMRLISGPR